jgi:hypothetical protein
LSSAPVDSKWLTAPRLSSVRTTGIDASHVVEIPSSEVNVISAVYVIAGSGFTGFFAVAGRAITKAVATASRMIVNLFISSPFLPPSLSGTPTSITAFLGTSASIGKKPCEEHCACGQVGSE